ncbi:unnamed protein product, partial [marine sediment metagenome]
MPDFPSGGGGASAAQVWAYGTRGLTGDAANAVRDAILSDATKIPGANINAAINDVKLKTDMLPTDPADQSLIIAATNALSGEIATRAPSGEYDTQLDANVSTRAPANEYDTELDAAISTRAAIADYTSDRAAKIDKVQDLIEEANGTLSATGSEDTIKEITATVNKLHCFIDLTAMQASDTIVVRQFMKIKVAGSFIKYAEETYSDV